MNYRPPGVGAVPKDFIEAVEHPAFRHGTVVYTRELTADEVRSYELTRIVPVETIAQAISERLSEYAAEYLDRVEISEAFFRDRVQAEANQLRREGLFCESELEVIVSDVEDRLTNFVNTGESFSSTEPELFIGDTPALDMQIRAIVDDGDELDSLLASSTADDLSEFLVGDDDASPAQVSIGDNAQSSQLEVPKAELSDDLADDQDIRREGIADNLRPDLIENRVGVEPSFSEAVDESAINTIPVVAGEDAIDRPGDVVVGNTEGVVSDSENNDDNFEVIDQGASGEDHRETALLANDESAELNVDTSVSQGDAGSVEADVDTQTAEEVADKGFDGLSVNEGLEDAERPLLRISDRIQDVAVGNTFAEKQAHDLALLPVLARLMQASNAESAGEAAPVVELSESDLRNLAGFRGHLSFGMDGANPAHDKNSLDYALQYVRMVSSWKRQAQDVPSAEEKRSYGETPIDDGITNAATARAIVKAAGAVCQFEVTNALATSLWDVGRHLGLAEGSKVFLPNSGNGVLSRLRPNNLKLKVTQVPNDPTGHEIARVLHPEDVVVKGLYESLILPSSYYDFTMAVSHYDATMNMMGLSKEGPLVSNDDVINMESDTPKLNKAHHLLYKSMKMIRAGGVGIFVVPRSMISAYGREALNRISQFSSVIAMSSLDGHLVRGHGSESHQLKGVNPTSLIQEANRQYICVVLKKREEPLSFQEAITAGDTDWVMPQEFRSLSPDRVIGSMALDDMSVIYNPRTYDSLINEANDAWLPAIVDMLGNERIDIAAGERLGLAERGEFLVLSDAPSAKNSEGIYERSYVLLENGIDVGVIRDGQPTPFMGTAQDNDRIRSMIDLRGAVLRTVRAQQSHADDRLLQEEQARLRVVYDDFVRKHGPVHSSVNLETFKGEPSLPQLLALEVYDLDSNTAEKTEFFTHRVIGKPKLVEKADNAAEALAISMGKVGYVSPGIMSALMGRNWSDLLHDVKGEVFMDPLEGRWVTRNQYLSGNVRGKLDSAIKAAAIDPELFSVNVSCLREVQPVDSPVEETDFQIGAAWIPAEDHRRFIGDLLGMNEAQRNDAISIVFNPISARWSLTIADDVGNEQVRQNYQTANKTITEIILATLNSTPLRVSMAVDAAGNRIEKEELKVAGGKRITRRVTDSVETAQVHLIQERLKDEFSRWAVANPLRGARLNSLYNLKVNAFKERVYDGSYLRLEKLSPLRQLMSQQINATARAIEDGFELIAHAVGSGKSATLAAIAMEHVSMGLARKPLITVPKSVITGFAGEIIRFFPAAKVLIESDLSIGNVEGVKSFIARASMDNWDIILMTHDSFRAVPLSKEAQRILLKISLNDVHKGLAVSSDRVLEMKRKTLSDRMERLSAEIESMGRAGLEDYGFDKTGVDLLLVDEVHLFKNMGIQTKMNVLGINKTESLRAVDMLSKSRYMSFLNGGKRGFIGATATAICNSISEMYPMMDLHRPSVLVSMGIRHFDSWASTFGRVQTLIEQKPAGDGWQMRDRFIRFQNVRELCRSFRMVADVRTDDDMPEVASKRPTVTNHLVVSPKDRIDEAFLKSLELRSKSLATGSPLWKKDSVIALIGDMQRGMLDMRSICPDLPANPRSIATLAAENIARIYYRESARKGTQLVFCDTAINSTKGSYSIVNDVRNQLIDAGIPASEIALMHEHDKPEQRLRVQNRINAGKIRVCMGSSDRLGLGTNVQKRGCAMHHLDLPTRPDKLEQRIGRFWRMGNEYVDVGVENYIYAKQGNTRRFETVQNKLIPIKQALKNPDLADRHLSEELDQTLEEFQAELTDNPLLRTKVAIDARARHLDLLRRGHMKDVAMWSARVALSRGRVESLTSLRRAVVDNKESLTGYFDAVKARQEEITAHNNYMIKVDQAFWNAFSNGRKIVRAIAKETAQASRLASSKVTKAPIQEHGIDGDEQFFSLRSEGLLDQATDLNVKDEVGTPHELAAPVGGSDQTPMALESPSDERDDSGKSGNASSKLISELFPPVGSREFIELIATDASKEVLDDVLKKLEEIDWRADFLRSPEVYRVKPITDAFFVEVDGQTSIYGLDVIGNRINELHFESNFTRRPLELGNVGPYKVMVVGNSLVRNRDESLSSRTDSPQLQISVENVVVLTIDLGLSASNNASKLFIRIKDNLLETPPDITEALESLRLAEVKAAEAFEFEDDWRRAQEEKAEVDSQLLLLVKESDPEADRDLLACLLGARSRTGRPLHPEELKAWEDNDDSIDEAVLGDGEDDDARPLADVVDRRAIRDAADAFEAQMRMAGP